MYLLDASLVLKILLFTKQKTFWPNEMYAERENYTQYFSIYSSHSFNLLVDSHSLVEIHVYSKGIPFP
jgi:hypothetical protein